MTSDAQARVAALDPARSFIVQAPAGSGKTELLTQRYLRLLAIVESPEQILAITFTRKAAAEMRARIVRALEAAQGAAPESPHKRLTWELARAVLEADTRRGWQLAQHPSRLQLRTIDALNATLSRRLPVLSGVGAALEPSPDSRALYEAAGERLIERLGEGSQVATLLEALIVHLGNRVDRLIEMLCDLLAKRDQWLHPLMQARASADLRERLEATLQRVVERHLATLSGQIDATMRRELHALLQFSAANLLDTETLDPSRRAQLVTCIERAEPPDATAACLGLWRGLAMMLLKKDGGGLYSRVDKRHGFPSTAKDWKERIQNALAWFSARPALCNRLADLASLPDPRYSETQWQTLAALLALLPEAVAELQLEFQSQGQADYVEVALRALRALGSAEEPTDLALALDHRVQHILVDEFQDTSFTQLDLLERLTAGWSQGDGRTLFCVGDPMQSIYRFRQADVGLFIEMQQRGLRHMHLEPLRLEANFRSVPAIVDWVNRVFPDVLAPANDAEQGAVRYSPSTAALSGSEGKVHVRAFFNAGSEAEAECVTQIVRDTLQVDPAGRLAILVTARTHVEAIGQQLTSAGIEFRAVEIEQLRDRPVVQDLIALTRALVHLADRTAWLAILRAPWCGLALADLHAVAGQSSYVVERAIRDVLANDENAGLSGDGRQRLRRVHGVLTAALGERGRWPLRIWVERTWNALGGPATLTRLQDLDDALAYFARLQELEIAGDLEDIAALELQLGNLFSIGKVRGDTRVEVMTVHAAKGLEFETVILPGLHRRPRHLQRELLRWTRIAGPEGGVVLAPVRAEGSDHDPIYRWIEDLEAQRIQLERARLLYVAATRAKRDLYLLGSVKAKQSEQGVEIGTPQSGSMLSMLWKAVEADFEGAVDAGQVSASAAIAPTTRIRRLPIHWAAPTEESLLTLAAEPASAIDAEKPVFDWASHTSRHVGTLVHRELDRWCRTPSDRSHSHERSRLILELAELGVPADRCEAACDRVIEAMELTLQDERGRWLLGLDQNLQDPASELGLSGVIEGRIIEGVIDRTFVDTQGTRWIVDFKTSTHEGGGREAFLDEEVERYRPQLRRYVHLMRAFRPEQPVKAALYFPLMCAWREVAV